MITPHPRHPVDIAREQIAGQIEQYLAAGGSIEVLPGFVSVPPKGISWRGSLSLPGSSTSTRQANKDAALARQIEELAAKGVGISTIAHDLRSDFRRVRRIAIAFGIKIKAQKMGRTPEDETVQRRRAALAEKIRPLAAQGLRIKEIATRIRSSTETVQTVIRLFDIPRGQRMDLD